MKHFETVDFQPYPLLSSPHLQMLVASFISAGKEPPTEQFPVKCSDGDILVCEMSTPLTWKEHDETIVLLHGLGGSCQSPYMIRLSLKFYLQGKKVIRVNLRGCGSGQGKSKRTYHGGLTQDIKEVLHRIKDTHPQSKVTLIGFSLGGNLLLKLLGELGASPNIKKGIAICPILNLYTTMKMVGSKKNWIYHQYYLNNLLNQCNLHIDKKKIHSIYQFDNVVTAPTWGFRNAEDYYEKNSAIFFINQIIIPTTILLTKDDPFIHYKEIEEAEPSSSTKVLYAEHGSHMGFIGSSSNFKGPFWLDDFIIHESAT